MKVIKNTYQNQSGQMLIIIVLILVVGITIALSLASRSITDIRLSTNTEQTNRAYTAAEAGVEQALKEIGAGGVPPANGSVSFESSSANYTTTSLGGSEFAPIETTDKDGVVQVKLTGVSGDGANKIWVSWGGDPGVKPAIVASMIYDEMGPGENYTIEKWAFDPDGTRYSSNGFNNSDILAGDVTYPYKVLITIPPNDILKEMVLRIRPLYARARFKFAPSGGYSLPTQGYLVESTGVSGSSERTVQVYKSDPVLPSIFDYVLFSGGNLSK